MKQFEKTVVVKSIISSSQEVVNEQTGEVETIESATIYFAEGTLPYIECKTFTKKEAKSKTYPVSYLIDALKRSNSNLASIPNLNVAMVNCLMQGDGTITFIVKEYEPGDVVGTSVFEHTAFRASIIGATLNGAALAYVKANVDAQMKAIFGF